MADRATLLALAERCETATGPDRELDGAIYIAVLIPAERAGRIDQNGGFVGWWPKDGPYVGAREVPAYTASLDAALTLVPEGWHWSADSRRFGYVRGRGPQDGAPDPEGWARGTATPALALCAAALRALAAQAEGGA